MKKRPQPAWTDVLDRDAIPVTIEEQVDTRRKAKRLQDCALPEGFRLACPQPRQMRFDGQMRWAFVLEWRERGGDPFFFAARYEVSVADEIQMFWALDDFKRELREAGYEVEAPAIKNAKTARGNQLKTKLAARLQMAYFERIGALG